MIGKSAYINTFAKITILVAILVFEPWEPLIGRLNFFLITDRYPQAAIFLLIATICFTAFIVIPFLQSAVIRVPLVLLTVGAFAFNHLFTSLSGQSLDPNQVTTLWRERAMIGDAVSGYFWDGLRTAGWFLPAAIILTWKPASPVSLPSRWIGLPIIALLSCFSVAKLTLTGPQGFPTTFSVPAMMASAITSQTYSGPRDEVTYTAQPQPLFRHIVMIVDESVRGDYLQINITPPPPT